MELLNEKNRFIPFISDYGFKVTFGNENNTVFLKRALQALIRSPFRIENVEFDKTTFDGVTIDGRRGIYDLICTDEIGTVFIVEMQSSPFKYFLQRMKFYAAQKFNTMVRRGEYKYDDLSRIYCVGILKHRISVFEDYHNVGCLKNQDGDMMDDQTIYITVELDKFYKTEEDCKTDLEKLIFTMKNLSEMENIKEKPIKYPTFWTEEWLKIAIDELDKRNMSPDEYGAYVKIIEQNTHAVRQAKEELDQATTIAKLEGKLEGKLEALRDSTTRLILTNRFSDAEIAEFNDVSIEFIQNTRRELGKIDNV